MRILVTGANGFLGGHLVHDLRAAGHDVTALVRTKEKAEALARAGFRVATADLANPQSLADAMQGHDAVVHAAGIASTDASLKALGWSEVAGAENAARAAHHAGVRRFVLISSADATLTGVPRLSVHEDVAIIAPLFDAFARTKKEAEEVVLTLGRRDFEPVVVRPARVWGPNDTHWLPQLVREGLSGGARIYGRAGTFMATTYVGNLTVGVERALVTPDARGLIFHVLDDEIALQRSFLDRLAVALDVPPSMRGTHNLTLARLLARVGKAQDVSVHEVVRRGVSSSFDGRRARELLGYRPSHTFEDGLDAVARWVRDSGGPEAVLAQAKSPPRDEAIVPRT